jgi:hypothetical protein
MGTKQSYHATNDGVNYRILQLGIAHTYRTFFRIAVGRRAPFISIHESLFWMLSNRRAELELFTKGLVILMESPCRYIYSKERRGMFVDFKNGWAIYQLDCLFQASKQPIPISGFCTAWKNAVINLPSGLMNSKYLIS